MPMVKEEKELRDEVVVEPRPSKLDPPLSDPLIFCPVNPLLVLAARVFKARKNLRPLGPAKVYSFRHQGRKLSMIGPGMGAPLAVYLLERAIANGARRVILFGICGSVHPEVRIGDVVVPTEALIDEGTSRNYVSGAKRALPSESAVAAIRKALDSSAKSYHLGPIWTTDAVFRETKSKVKACGERGVLAVEMEASALFTVARYRGIELGAIMVVSDELFDLRWHPGFARPRFISALNHALRIARNAALVMAGAEPEAGAERAEEETPASAEAGPEATGE